jgi:hypothetical protein
MHTFGLSVLCWVFWKSLNVIVLHLKRNIALAPRPACNQEKPQPRHLAFIFLTNICATNSVLLDVGRSVDAILNPLYDVLCVSLVQVRSSVKLADYVPFFSAKKCTRGRHSLYKLEL